MEACAGNAAAVRENGDILAEANKTMARPLEDESRERVLYPISFVMAFLLFSKVPLSNVAKRADSAFIQALCLHFMFSLADLILIGKAEILYIREVLEASKEELGGAGMVAVGVGLQFLKGIATGIASIMFSFMLRTCYFMSLMVGADRLLGVEMLPGQLPLLYAPLILLPLRHLTDVFGLWFLLSWSVIFDVLAVLFSLRCYLRPLKKASAGRRLGFLLLSSGIYALILL